MLKHQKPHVGPPGSASRVVKILRILVNADPSIDIEWLARIADELNPTGREGAFLREHCAALPVNFAIDKLGLHMHEHTINQHLERLTAAESLNLAMIVPVPPHLYDQYAWFAGAIVLKLDHHELPPKLRYDTRLKVCTDRYDAVRIVQAADLIFFDGYAEDGLYVRRSIADLLDERNLKPAVRLCAHFRPHKDDTDVRLSPAVSGRVEQI